MNRKIFFVIFLSFAASSFSCEAGLFKKFSVEKFEGKLGAFNKKIEEEGKLAGENSAVYSVTKLIEFIKQKNGTVTLANPDAKTAENYVPEPKKNYHSEVTFLAAKMAVEALIKITDPLILEKKKEAWYEKHIKPLLGYEESAYKNSIALDKKLDPANLIPRMEKYLRAGLSRAKKGKSSLNYVNKVKGSLEAFDKKIKNAQFNNLKIKKYFEEIITNAKNRNGTEVLVNSETGAVNNPDANNKAKATELAYKIAIEAGMDATNPIITSLRDEAWYKFIEKELLPLEKRILKAFTEIDKLLTLDTIIKKFTKIFKKVLKKAKRIQAKTSRIINQITAPSTIINAFQTAPLTQFTGKKAFEEYFKDRENSYKAALSQKNNEFLQAIEIAKAKLGEEEFNKMIEDYKKATKQVLGPPKKKIGKLYLGPGKTKTLFQRWESKYSKLKKEYQKQIKSDPRINLGYTKYGLPLEEGYIEMLTEAIDILTAAQKPFEDKVKEVKDAMAEKATAEQEALKLVKAEQAKAHKAYEEKVESEGLLEDFTEEEPEEVKEEIEIEEEPEKVEDEPEKTEVEKEIEEKKPDEEKDDEPEEVEEEAEVVEEEKPDEEKDDEPEEPEEVEEDDDEGAPEAPPEGLEEMLEKKRKKGLLRKLEVIEEKEVKLKKVETKEGGALSLDDLLSTKFKSKAQEAFDEDDEDKKIEITEEIGDFLDKQKPTEMMDQLKIKTMKRGLGARGFEAVKDLFKLGQEKIEKAEVEEEKEEEPEEEEEEVDEDAPPPDAPGMEELEKSMEALEEKKKSKKPEITKSKATLEQEQQDAQKALQLELEEKLAQRREKLKKKTPEEPKITEASPEEQAKAQEESEKTEKPTSAIEMIKKTMEGRTIEIEEKQTDETGEESDWEEDKPEEEKEEPTAEEPAKPAITEESKPAEQPETVEEPKVTEPVSESEAPQEESAETAMYDDYLKNMEDEQFAEMSEEFAFDDDELGLDLFDDDELAYAF